MTRRQLLPAALAVATLLAAVDAGAQTLPPRYKVVFTASADNAVNEFGAPLVTRYDLAITAPGGTTPVTTIDLGKPVPDAQNVITADIHTQLLALPASLKCDLTNLTPATCYTAVVTAVGSGGTTPSLPSPPFPLLPAKASAPGAPAVGRR